RQPVAPATSEPCETGEQGDGAAEPDGAVQTDLDELVAAAAQRAEFLALAQRTQADFENYRKRVSRDLAGAEARGVVKLARELLPALDNLERALAAGEAGDTDGAEA